MTNATTPKETNYRLVSRFGFVILDDPLAAYKQIFKLADRD